MGFKTFFHLFLSLSILTGANCTPAACTCGCRPPPPQPCAPVMPIMLDNCGPNPCPLPPINAPPVQTPLVNKPPVALPSCVPPTKTVANTCHCVKTVVKPQVVQQLITVPTIQRYIQTTHTPVVENIHYQGIPINCPPYAPEPAAPAAAPVAPAAALALAKPPAPAALPPNLLALLSLIARQPPPVPACAPACAPACVPSPPPALPPCLPCLPTAAPPPSAVLTIPPSLLALLSKLL